jgi:hypothetical protein
MLAFVELIHALPTRGEESTQFMLPESFASREEKLGEMHLFRGAYIHAFGSSLSPEF